MIIFGKISPCTKSKCKSFSQIFSLFLSVILAMELMGCSPTDEYREITIEKSKYEFPQDDINGIYEGPGEKYIRLVPKDEYMLIYSSTKNYRNNTAITDVPTIADINDTGNYEFHVLHSGEMVIVCSATNLRYNCGMRVEDRGSLWSLKFDRADINRSAELLREANSYLSRYRRK